MDGWCNDRPGRRGGRRDGWSTMFGADGLFGASGPFGPGGPFGSGWSGSGFRGGSDGKGGASDHGPRGRRRMFGRSEFRLVLLSLIAEQPRHGYDLIKAMEERSGGHYSPSPGVIYPALAMLADEGLVVEQASEDQRRSYALTEAGRHELDAEPEQAEAAMARLTRLGERAERQSAPSIERAAASLFMAVAQRMRSERNEELPHRIAEILDEAARRIERL